MERLKVFDLLPKTDCQRCGHDTCLVFATELTRNRASLEACPDVSDEVRTSVLKIVAAKHSLAASLRKSAAEIKKGDIKGAYHLLHDVFIKFPGSTVNFLLVTFPLSIPITLIIIWLCIS